MFNGIPSMMGQLAELSWQQGRGMPTTHEQMPVGGSAEGDEREMRVRGGEPLVRGGLRIIGGLLGAYSTLVLSYLLLGWTDWFIRVHEGESLEALGRAVDFLEPVAQPGLRLLALTIRSGALPAIFVVSLGIRHLLYSMRAIASTGEGKES